MKIPVILPTLPRQRSSTSPTLPLSSLRCAPSLLLSLLLRPVVLRVLTTVELKHYCCNVFQNASNPSVTRATANGFRPVLAGLTLLLKAALNVFPFPSAVLTTALICSLLHGTMFKFYRPISCIQLHCDNTGIVGVSYSD
jgi:hypothetical protein